MKRLILSAIVLTFGLAMASVSFAAAAPTATVSVSVIVASGAVSITPDPGNVAVPYMTFGTVSLNTFGHLANKRAIFNTGATGVARLQLSTANAGAWGIDQTTNPNTLSAKDDFRISGFFGPWNRQDLGLLTVADFAGNDVITPSPVSCSDDGKTYGLDGDVTPNSNGVNVMPNSQRSLFLMLDCPATVTSPAATEDQVVNIVITVTAISM
jgi:hypothetical protein